MKLVFSSGPFYEGGGREQNVPWVAYGETLSPSDNAQTTIIHIFVHESFVREFRRRVPGRHEFQTAITAVTLASQMKLP